MRLIVYDEALKFSMTKNGARSLSEMPPRSDLPNDCSQFLSCLLLNFGETPTISLHNTRYYCIPAP